MFSGVLPKIVPFPQPVQPPAVIAFVICYSIKAILQVAQQAESSAMDVDEGKYCFRYPHPFTHSLSTVSCIFISQFSRFG
jgi:hypothetical protein